MALKKDIVQLDIIIGNNQSRAKLAELQSEAAELNNKIRSVKAEHLKYEKAAKKMVSVKENMEKSKRAAALLESELTGLRAEHAKVTIEIQKQGTADSVLTAKEKELSQAIKLKNTELKLEESRYKSLEREQTKLIAVMNRMKSGSDEYIAASKRLEVVKEEMQGLRKAFSLTEMTMKELRNEAKRLKFQLDAAVPGSEAYLKYEKRLQAVNARISELNIKSKGAALAQLTLREKISKGVDWFNKYAASIVSVLAGLAGLVFSVRKTIDAYNEFEQTEADLSALTGLTGENLKFLSDSAREMSTSITKDGIRIKNSAVDIEKAFGIVGSQRPELLKSKEALKEVTESALILAAAGDGQLQPATVAVTTALNNFELAADQARRVINTYGAGSKEGAADISKLTMVVDKAGTTANLMKLEFEDVIAIAEAVAPKFNDMRIAGNSLDKVLLKMKDSGMGYKDGVFDMNRALDELRVRTSKGEKVTKLFGVEHAKFVEVLLAEQDEMNRYRKVITDTNVAVEQAAIKTDTNAAKLEQAKNKAKENAMILGEQLAPALTFSTNLFSKFLKVIVVLIKNWDTYKKYVYVAITAIAAYTLVAKGAAIQQSLFNTAVKLGQKVMSLFNKTVSKNPLALLATAFASAVAASFLFRKEATESEKAVKNFNKELIKEKNELNNVFDALNKTNPGTEERRSLIDKINKEYGKYLPKLLDETSSLNEIKQAQELANKALEKNIALKIKGQAIEDIYNKAIEVRAETVSNVIEQITKDNKHLTEVASGDFEKLLNNAVASGKVIESELQNFAKKYNLTGSLLLRGLRKNIEATIEAEQEKSQELINIDAAFSGYLKEETKKTYNQELIDLKKSLRNKVITEEEYQKQLLELRKKYGISYDTDGKDGDKKKITITGTTDTKKTKDDTEMIKKLIQSMNLELIEDERKKAEQEIEIWYQAEKKKIEISKTSTAIKNEAVESLEDLHKKKLLDLDDKYYQQSLDVFNNVHNFLVEKRKELEQSRLSAEETEIAKIKGKYNSEIDALNEQLQLKNDLYDEFLQQKNDLEKLRDEEIKAYKEEKEREHAERIKEVKKEYGLTTDQEDFDAEIEKLTAYYEQKLISDENYEKAKDSIKKKFDDAERERKRLAFEEETKRITEGIKKELGAINAIGEAFTAAKEYELEVAGDNEAKKKEIMKKYADKEFAVKAGQIIANAAVAVLQAFAQLGPIAGAIAAGAIAVTTGFQLSKADAERKKIKQLAKGKYPVVGADDGKLYNADYKRKLGTGIVRKPTLVAEEPEMVVDHRTLYNPKKDKYGMTVMDHARSIMALKVARVPQRAEGKYSSVNKAAEDAQENAINVAMLKLLSSMNDEIKALRDDVNNWQTLLKSYVVNSELEAKQLELENAKNNAAA